MSKLIYLSKSDFKIAKSCPTKLYYKKLGYPQNQEEDYTFSISTLIIHKIAELLYDNPIIIEINDQGKDDISWALEKTNKHLQQENITILNPLIYHQHKLTKIDILSKRGNKFDLVYIRPKAIDPKYKPLFRNKRDGKISAIWYSYLQDITYQTYILSELLSSLYTDFEINSYLCLPIKDHVSKSCLGSNFTISSDYKVKFLGDIRELRNDHILQFINVNEEILELKPKVVDLTKIYIDSIVGDIQKIPNPINKNCKNCEFRLNELQQSDHNLSNDSRNGFNECWSLKNYVKDHILDLYQVAKIGEYNNLLINTLIEQGKSSLYDIPLDSLNHSSFKNRQLIQINHSRNNKEWISEDLVEVLNSFTYPLHFIDFETCRLDIPYSHQLRANEQIAFQWSCHTITKESHEYINTNFIDVSGKFPNFKFAESLKKQLGNEGTVFVWGTHEKSVLKDIYEQAYYYQYQNQDILIWLESLISDFDQNVTPNLHIVDMNSLTLKHYFHPLMKSKTSLKSVLPAIWTTNSYLHEVSWLSQYLQRDRSGQVLSPYQTLPQVEIDHKYQVIKEGSGAMLAYQEILYRPYKDDQNIKEKWEILLKQYCCLDTLAMVIVWTHWQHLIDSRSKIC